MLGVFGLTTANPVERVETLPVRAGTGGLDHSIAVRISRRRSTDLVLFAHATAATRGTWRVADIETDAHVLFCRTGIDGLVARVAMVDGAFAHAPARGLRVDLPRVAPDLHADFTRQAAASAGLTRR
jgi:hypothetical protein